MDTHKLCIVCKYWRIYPWTQPQPGFSHEQHHRMFRADDIGATVRYYSTIPFYVPPNTDMNYRRRVRDSTRRFEDVIRSHDDVYGITGIIILLESLYYVNSTRQEGLMIGALYYGLPAAEHIRLDYPVRPRQQTPSFSNSLVSSTSAQQSQQTPSFNNSLVSSSAQQSHQTPSFSNSLVSTGAQQSQHQRCTACIYLARNCSVNCWFAQFFQPNFSGDFEAVCRTQFERRNLAYNTRTSRQELTSAEITQIQVTTRLFEHIIRTVSCPDYGATGIVISLVILLRAVNTGLDFLEEISDDRVQQLVEQYHSPQVPRYPAPSNVNTGGQQQQHQQFQRGAKRSLEQGGPQIHQQRPRLQGPSNQPAGPCPRPYQRAGPCPRPYQRAGPCPRLQQPEIPLLEPALPQPRLQQPVRFPHHPTPFQQPYPPAAFQQPPYQVQMQGYQTRPLPQSQESAVPSQFQHLFAGTNSSSSATSSQSQFQSQQQHYFSTGNSSSAAVVGQPDTHHQVPLATIQFSDDEQDTYWGEEEKQLNQGLPPYQVQMEGHQTRPLPQSQEPAAPCHSWQLYSGINSLSGTSSQSQQQLYFSFDGSSSAAVVGQPHCSASSILNSSSTAATESLPAPSVLDDNNWRESSAVVGEPHYPASSNLNSFATAANESLPAPSVLDDVDWRESSGVVGEPHYPSSSNLSSSATAANE
ncbi:hypothetical protein MKW98_016134 [Papaver atlanticum]|uniref:Uncharacterized protein n=1 Tax=Papaver atlanticum TaxID=357466 RepID=A0AAD4T3I8_9MAGN|nr:hypothetical protein MKW98_016134 [Papaver atlanticum]